MTETTEAFIAKSLVSLQKQIGNLEESLGTLEQRIRDLEPQEPDEFVIRLADGSLRLYMARDEESGKYSVVRSAENVPGD